MDKSFIKEGFLVKEPSLVEARRSLVVHNLVVHNLEEVVGITPQLAVVHTYFMDFHYIHNPGVIFNINCFPSFYYIFLFSKVFFFINNKYIIK